VTLNFRSILTLDGADAERALDTAREQFGCWLRSKNLSADDLGTGRHRVGEDAAVLVSAAYPVDGSCTLRLELRETQHPLRWITTLTAHRPADPADALAYLWVDNAALLLSPEATRPRSAAPRLVRLLVDTATVTDHGTPLTSQPITVRTEDDVYELVGALLDPHRQVPVIVASHCAGGSSAAWNDALAEATRGLAGIAALFRLTPRANTLLDEHLGPHYYVKCGAVRSYLPALNLADIDDARRHRVLSSRRLLESPRQARQLLSSVPLQLALAHPLPPALAHLHQPATIGVDPGELAGRRAAGQEAVRRFDQLSRAWAQSDATSQPERHKPAPQPRWPEVDELRHELQQARQQARDLRAELDKTTTALDRSAAELKDTREELQDEVDRLQAAQEDLIAEQSSIVEEIGDHETTQADLRAALNRVRFLREQLVAAGAAAAAYTEPEAVSPPPRSFDELLDRVGELTYLNVDVERELTLALDDNLKCEVWASKAWDALLALEDYASARIAGVQQRDFRAYCQDPPAGRRVIPLRTVALDESDATKNNPRYAAARRCRVPTEVHSCGAIHMWAHIKLGNSDGSAPRVHFWDDTGGVTSRIHIGYLGPHLPTTLTN
jgi:hypothetical protein